MATSKLQSKNNFFYVNIVLSRVRQYGFLLVGKDIYFEKAIKLLKNGKSRDAVC